MFPCGSNPAPFANFTGTRSPPNGQIFLLNHVLDAALVNLRRLLVEYVVQQKDFPIQTTFTAVKMILQPGALREMHWHPHADEWQYYLSGQARMTVFGSHGRTRTEDYRKGNVGFVPQGYGHFIEQIGDQPAELLVLFNSPEYQEISLANWLGGNPSSMLSANFGIPQDAIDKLPKKERGIIRKS